MPQKPLLSLRTSPQQQTKLYCSQDKCMQRRKHLPPAKYSIPQNNVINQGKLLPPTKMLNSQIWLQQSTMFNPPNLISTSSSGEMVNNQKLSSSSADAGMICLNAKKNADPQSTINFSSTSKLIDKVDWNLLH